MMVDTLMAIAIILLALEVIALRRALMMTIKGFTKCVNTITAITGVQKGDDHEKN